MQHRDLTFTQLSVLRYHQMCVGTAHADMTMHDMQHRDLTFTQLSMLRYHQMCVGIQTRVKIYKWRIANDKINNYPYGTRYIWYRYTVTTDTNSQRVTVNNPNMTTRLRPCVLNTTAAC
jgi:hypothetical protein